MNSMVVAQETVLANKIPKGERTGLSKPCVYFLILGDEIIYVGQSINIDGRLSGHEVRDYEYYSYLTISSAELNKAECENIIHHNPRFNCYAPIYPEVTTVRKMCRDLSDLVRLSPIVSDSVIFSREDVKSCALVIPIDLKDVITTAIGDALLVWSKSQIKKELKK
jgi:hypothetical protein